MVWSSAASRWIFGPWPWPCREAPCRPPRGRAALSAWCDGRRASHQRSGPVRHRRRGSAVGAPWLRPAGPGRAAPERAGHRCIPVRTAGHRRSIHPPPVAKSPRPGRRRRRGRGRRTAGGAPRADRADRAPRPAAPTSRRAPHPRPRDAHEVSQGQPGSAMMRRQARASSRITGRRDLHDLGNRACSRLATASTDRQNDTNQTSHDYAEALDLTGTTNSTPNASKSPLEGTFLSTGQLGSWIFHTPSSRAIRAHNFSPPLPRSRSTMKNTRWKLPIIIIFQKYRKPLFGQYRLCGHMKIFTGHRISTTGICPAHSPHIEGVKVSRRAFPCVRDPPPS